MFIGGGAMREPIEIDLEARGLESAEAQTLMNLTRSADWRLGPLFLLILVINVAVVMLAWLLVGLLNG
jgi:hypothetical protein